MSRKSQRNFEKSTLTGVNFLVELGLNLVLSPAVSTLIRAIRKTHN